ncbi:MAG: hypothetical protein HKN13_04610 [Rhodothermales bacterium]|nr:hypothetical protein [Rhodothermales bacterium]
MRVLSTLCILVLFAILGCNENLPTSIQGADEGSDVLAKSENAAVNYTKKFLVGIGEDWCAIFGSDNEVYFDWHANAVHNLQTKGGNEVFSCTMKGVFNDTGKVLYFDDEVLPPGYRDESDPGTYMSATFFGLSSNWWARVTPSGKATIKVFVNPSGGEFMTFDEYCELYPDGVQSWACG